MTAVEPSSEEQGPERSFHAIARLAFLSSTLGVAAEVLAIVLGVAALIVALGLLALPVQQPILGAELLGLGATVGAIAGICWLHERRPNQRQALWRVDRWFELDGALVTAWELEQGKLSSPSFQGALADRVSRSVVDKKEIGRAAFALTLPILMVPLAGAAVLAGVQEERNEKAAALEASANQIGASVSGQDAGSDDQGVAPQIDLDFESEAGETDGVAGEIAELQAMKQALEDPEQAPPSGAEGALGPEAKQQLADRIDQRIAELQEKTRPGAETGETTGDDSSESTGDENQTNGPPNASNPGEDEASVVTDSLGQGRIRDFQGVSPTGVWWPAHQDEIVRSWLMRLESTDAAAE